MANEEQLKILKKGVAAWNEWRMKNSHLMIDLMAANLSGANLKAAYFRRANLVEANLAGADLSDANLFQANLYKADLRGANLDKVNLSQAVLTAADLNGAVLDDTNFAFAVMGFTRITKVDLRKSMGLESSTSGSFPDFDRHTYPFEGQDL